MQPRRCLLTGGAGFIGSWLARHLHIEGYRVIILDNLSTGKRKNIPAGVKVIEGDVVDLI
ncbi:MAG: NAD-dependent epimerase/dehydratase family protein [Thermaerobacterales bacterium]